MLAALHPWSGAKRPAAAGAARKRGFWGPKRAKLAPPGLKLDLKLPIALDSQSSLILLSSAAGCLLMLATFTAVFEKLESRAINGEFVKAANTAALLVLNNMVDTLTRR